MDLPFSLNMTIAKTHELLERKVFLVYIKNWKIMDKDKLSIK